MPSATRSWSSWIMAIPRLFLRMIFRTTIVPGKYENEPHPLDTRIRLRNRLHGIRYDDPADLCLWQKIRPDETKPGFADRGIFGGAVFCYAGIRCLLRPFWP